jgi:vacuolar protein sorting-associated protein 13A/C
MVFEKAVSSFLTSYMQQYVESFDANQLRVGVWQGCINLTNLKVRPDAIPDAGLPVRIVAGHVDKLRITIPWNNLGQHPVQVIVAIFGRGGTVMGFDSLL